MSWRLIRIRGMTRSSQRVSRCLKESPAEAVNEAVKSTPRISPSGSSWRSIARCLRLRYRLWAAACSVRSVSQCELSWYLGRTRSRLGSSCLVSVDLAVSLGCNGLTRWPTDYLVNRRSGFQKRGIPVLRMVAGIANIAGDLELHMANYWAEVALMQRRRRSRPCDVLRRTNLDEVDPVDLDGAAVSC